MFNMSLVGAARASATQAVNQGIDARLEGFTKSSFHDNGRRLECKVHDDELQILIRRLLEIGTDEAGELADDIVGIEFLREDER